MDRPKKSLAEHYTAGDFCYNREYVFGFHTEGGERDGFKSARFVCKGNHF